MGRVVLRLFFLLIVLSAVAGGGLAWGYALWAAPGPLKIDATIIIPKGAGVKRITQLLHSELVIGAPLIFRLGVRLSGADKGLQAGEYAFPAHISPQDVATALTSGKTVVRRLTLAEGLTTAQVLAQLSVTEGLKGLAALRPAEGALLPETYHFSYGDSRAELIERMMQAMDETLDQLWEKRSKGLPFNTPAEALVLASMVEKETALPQERPRIAAVFINRLRKGMRLQSDPTVAYALTEGKEPLGRSLTKADLKAPSPYNTYWARGLPPGPICNPGRASIAAVLNPPVTAEFYFVADGAGGHVFARTLKGHNRNVARWRKVQKQRQTAD